jgi:hypothetical protein
LVTSLKTQKQTLKGWGRRFVLHVFELTFFSSQIAPAGGNQSPNRKQISAVKLLGRGESKTCRPKNSA